MRHQNIRQAFGTQEAILGGRHFWAKRYCVSTVGLNEEEVRKYVKWQQVKDKRMEQLKLRK
jgi:putative transposase